MGLDMNLYKKHYVKNWDHYKENERTELKIEAVKDGKPVNIATERVCYIVEEVGYWRKANAIHRWFVDNTQGGEDRNGASWVDEDQLIELKELCQMVLADHSKAEDLLPTGSGFFFGSTDYDEYYYQSLESTIKIIDVALVGNNSSASVEYEYVSSW